jgi:hypothetical protein
VRARARGSRLDREVREFLREDPELLGLAELIASLRPDDVDSAAHAERRPRLRLSSAFRALSITARRRSSA